MHTLDKINGFVNRNFAVFIIGAVIIALMFPNVISPMAGMSFLTISVSDGSFTLTFISLMLAVVMFGTGTSINTADIYLILKNPRDVIVGVLAKYLFMALSAYAIAKLLGLNNQLAFGLILLGCMPPGTAAAVLVGIAGGEITLAVSITVISTLAAPLLTPALCYLFGGEWVSINVLSMMANITLVVLLPVICGIIVKSVFKERLKYFKKILTFFTLAAVLLIVAVSTAPNRQVILSLDSVIVIVAIALNFILAVAAYWALAKALKMNRARSTALMITSSEQNSGLSVGIAATFSAIYPAAVIPSIIAVAVNLGLAAVLTNILSRRASNEVLKNTTTAVCPKCTELNA